MANVTIFKIDSMCVRKIFHNACLIIFFLLVGGKSFSQLSFSSRSIFPSLDINKTLESKFKSFKIIALNPNEMIGLASKINASDSLQFSLKMDNDVLFFTLKSNDLRDKFYRSEIAAQGEIEKNRSPGNWFKGYLNNDTKQMVRVTIDENGIEGFFILDNKIMCIEPLRDHVTTSAPNHFIIYGKTDVLNTNNFCVATEIENYRTSLSARVSAPAGTAAVEKIIKIATDASYSYYQKFGSKTNSHILGIINQVEGLYSKDFGMTFKVTFQSTYQSDNDPYSSTNVTTLLDQFKNNWIATRQDIDRNIAFLFSATRLESDKVGAAYQGKACVDQSESYGFFSQTSFSLESLIVAHEIGHLFGASHDADCVSNSVMCPSLDNSTSFTFSQGAKNSINTFLNKNCLEVYTYVKVYPLPANASIFIECAQPDFSIALSNSLGQMVYFSSHIGNKAELMLNYLPNGLYIATITNALKVTTRKIQIIN